MTYIVGLIENGITWMGADSLYKNGYRKGLIENKKVFKLKDTQRGT